MLVAVQIGFDTYVGRKTREQTKAPWGRKADAAAGAAAPPAAGVGPVAAGLGKAG
jgi:hypothetical protein